ncbi:MAG: thioredoxin [bacterium]
MSENVKEIQGNGFDTAIREGVVLVDFWAPWCGPCRMQGPILEQVASEVGSKASIIKVNVDESPSVAAQFGVKGIPTLILFKGGKAVGQYVGVQRKDTLVAAIGQVSGN